MGRRAAVALATLTTLAATACGSGSSGLDDLSASPARAGADTLRVRPSRSGSASRARACATTPTPSRPPSRDTASAPSRRSATTRPGPTPSTAASLTARGVRRRRTPAAGRVGGRVVRRHRQRRLPRLPRGRRRGDARLRAVIRPRGDGGAQRAPGRRRHARLERRRGVSVTWAPTPAASWDRGEHRFACLFEQARPGTVRLADVASADFPSAARSCLMGTAFVPCGQAHDAERIAMVGLDRAVAEGQIVGARAVTTTDVSTWAQMPGKRWTASASGIWTPLRLTTPQVCAESRIPIRSSIRMPRAGTRCSAPAQAPFGVATVEGGRHGWQRLRAIAAAIRRRRWPRGGRTRSSAPRSAALAVAYPPSQNRRKSGAGSGRAVR